MAQADPLLNILQDALPLIAASTGGLATICDAGGRWLRSVGPDGATLGAAPPCVADLCLQAAVAGRPLAMITAEEPPVHIWAVPLGAWVLAASNRRKAAQERSLYLALKAALPLIARVAGGEAVIFDREGRRTASALPDGSHHPDLGKVHPVFRETMESQEALITPSRTTPGATSVRIPLSPDFGFGFTNAWTVRQDQRLMEEVRKHQHARYHWHDIIGRSPAIRRAVSLAQRAADATASVLIHGETGTGKELFAQAIHNGSSRRQRPFIAINCAALPPSLIESQLFGYVEGAFTGARRGGQPGYFEEADGGTLLLDEISEIDPPLQAKLLRVLQEKEVTRIGGRRTIRVDVRIIATTNRNLRQMVAAGSFREDLYYRLFVIDLRLPPLRERLEDIPLLAEHHLRKFSRLSGKVVTDVAQPTMARLLRHHWPGNVRELENCFERAFNMADGQVLLPQHLPPYLAAGDAPPANGPAHVPADPAGSPATSLAAAVAGLERDLIVRTLQAAGGVRVQAAERLGISPSTLWRKMKDLQIADAPEA